MYPIENRRLIAIKAVSKQEGELYVLFFQAIPGGKDGMKRSSQGKIVNGLKYMHLWTTLNQCKKNSKGNFHGEAHLDRVGLNSGMFCESVIKRGSKGEISQHC